MKWKSIENVYEWLKKFVWRSKNTFETVVKLFSGPFGAIFSYFWLKMVKPYFTVFFQFPVTVPSFRITRSTVWGFPLKKSWFYFCIVLGTQRREICFLKNVHYFGTFQLFYRQFFTLCVRTVTNILLTHEDCCCGLNLMIAKITSGTWF